MKEEEQTLRKAGAFLWSGTRSGELSSLRSGYDVLRFNVIRRSKLKVINKWARCYNKATLLAMLTLWRASALLHKRLNT